MRRVPTAKKLAHKLTWRVKCGSQLQRAEVIKDMTLNKGQSLG